MPKRKNLVALEDGLTAEFDVGPIVQAAATVGLDWQTPPVFVNALPLAAIVKQSPIQARAEFNPDKDGDDAEFLASVAENGVIEPIWVIPLPDQEVEVYQLVAGHRRTAAARLLEYDSIRALVFPTDSDPLELAKFAIIENFHRKDLAPLELAHTIARVMDIYHLSQKKTAKLMGVAVGTVNNYLSLLEVDTAVLALVENGVVGAANAKRLQKLPVEQKQVALKAVATGMSAVDALTLAKSDGLRATAGNKLSVAARAHVSQKDRVCADPVLLYILGEDDIRSLWQVFTPRSAREVMPLDDWRGIGLFGLTCNHDWRQAREEWNNLSHVARKAAVRFWPALEKALAVAHNSSREQFPEMIFQALSIAFNRVAENLHQGVMNDD